MDEFDWDDANIEHFSHRSISPVETEEVVLSEGRVLLGRGNVAGEPRFVIAGRTDQGRLLVVVYTYRNGRIRVITARPATSREARIYRRQRR